jgi:predicted nuclease of restriction endonuclease-like (RecB) superfamily
VLQTIEHGWSRSILALQIQSAAHTRAGKAVHNFRATLPPPQSDLAEQVLKDPYIFDFLTLAEPFRERELELALLARVQKFLLELGQGFAFVGRQYHLGVGVDDFYLDLLFYHLRLRCFVVVDLKRGPFKPEYAGKMNFYCNVVDDRLRNADDKPTVGIILCQEKNRVVAEYALKGVQKAIGVSGYQLTRALPKAFRSSLPTVDQMESELTRLTARSRRRDEPRIAQMTRIIKKPSTKSVQSAVKKRAAK